MKLIQLFMDAAWSFVETKSDLFISVIQFLVPDLILISLVLSKSPLLVNLIFLNSVTVDHVRFGFIIRRRIF